MREIAYSYDQNGLFVSVVKCQPCKRELGKWLLPARATWIAPPEGVDGKQRVFNGVKWEYRDVPKVPVVVEPHVEKSVEVRDNPDLLKVVVDNMRVDLEKRVFKAVGSKLENIEKSLMAHAHGMMAFGVDRDHDLKRVEDLVARVDSAFVELGVMSLRIENLASQVSTLISALSSIDERLSELSQPVNVVSGDPKTEVAAVEPRASKFKFWG